MHTYSTKQNSEKKLERIAQDTLNKMAEQQFKRNIAFKKKIGELLIGKPILEAEKFRFLELGNQQIVRVNVVGNIVDKYESTGDKTYIFFKLDDGSGQISLKVFGEDVQRWKDLAQGQTVIVIGVLRYFNNETYISPEIIKETDPKYLLVRKFEMEKEEVKNADPIDRETIVAVKDKILATIKNAEDDGGIEMDQIILNLKDISPEIIKQEVHKFIEEGIVFEPRPGKVRYLG